MSAMPPIPASASQLDSSSPSALKSRGNEAFNAKDYLLAGRIYTLAIDLLLKNANLSFEDEVMPTQAQLMAVDTSCSGDLHTLFSNRSLAMLKQSDYPAASSDAALCIQTSPSFAKGHMRLLESLDAQSAPISERRDVVRQALLCCPGNDQLMAKEMSYALMTDSSVSVPSTDNVANVIQDTLAIANDEKDPRSGIACGDIGSQYATGGSGLTKDLALAESYLTRGLAAGDAASGRYLGHVYLEQNNHTAAAEVLLKASQLGDEEATSMLKSMGEEAERKRKEAILKLQVMAERGDERARGMLEELRQEQ
jgi:TPR repeat protein